VKLRTKNGELKRGGTWE